MNNLYVDDSQTGKRKGEVLLLSSNCNNELFEMTINYQIKVNGLLSQTTLLEARKIDIGSSDSMLIVYCQIVIIVYRLLDTIRYTCLHNMLTLNPSYLM